MENNKIQTFTIPMAIVVAGFLIMIGLIFNRSSGVEAPKTLSEQVGVKKEALALCLKETKLEDLYKTTTESANLAMKNIPTNQRGTPYSVIVGKDGTKMELRGNIPYDDYVINEAGDKESGIKTIIDNMLAGTAKSDYKGEVPAPNESDHIIGSLDAKIIIIEYSDLECPFCNRFNVTAKKIVDESEGQVAWIYRHWIVHTQNGQNALPKAAASECVAKIKGNESFWKYIDLVFGLMEPKEAPITEQL